MDNPEVKAGININVGGNMQGHIVIGEGNTIIEQKALPTQRRSVSPKPPRKPAFFIGRSSELQQLEDSIRSCSPVVINGYEGIGKTSLVRQVANSEPAKAQKDGVVFVEGLDDSGKL